VTSAEVIERLRVATTGSRDLDVMICAAVYGFNRDHRSSSDSSVSVLGALAALRGLNYAKHYTTSLDIAQTLVPTGWNWQLRTLYRGGENISRAIVANDSIGFVKDDEYGEAEAATPALALCMAALRARSGGYAASSL
jgi:hypothetical protein